MKTKQSKVLGVVVCGALGRMGAQVARKIVSDGRFRLSGAIDRRVCKSAPESGGSSFGCLSPWSFGELLQNADIAVDFTAPEASVQFAAAAAVLKKPIVIGTTGFSPEQINAIKKSSMYCPVFISPNMSPAVNLMFYLAELAAGRLEGFDAHIIEVHHKMKKDAPSGTAKRLAQAVSRGEKNGFQPAVSSLRMGDITGEHTVLYAGPFERLEITHRAHSREVFAEGALEAALWLAGKKTGIYDYMDILKLKK